MCLVDPPATREGEQVNIGQQRIAMICITGSTGSACSHSDWCWFSCFHPCGLFRAGETQTSTENDPLGLVWECKGLPHQTTCSISYAGLQRGRVGFLSYVMYMYMYNVYVYIYIYIYDIWYIYIYIYWLNVYSVIYIFWFLASLPYLH